MGEINKRKTVAP